MTPDDVLAAAYTYRDLMWLVVGSGGELPALDAGPRPDRRDGSVGLLFSAGREHEAGLLGIVQKGLIEAGLLGVVEDVPELRPVAGQSRVTRSLAVRRASWRSIDVASLRYARRMLDAGQVVAVTEDGPGRVRVSGRPFWSRVTLTHGERFYDDLLRVVRGDRALVEAMWADAESSPAELDVPGTEWSVVLLGDGTPVAWCAARVDAEGVLKCHSNYEVRAWRGNGFYEAAYRARHRQVVGACGLPAVTYLFSEPIALHEADGWYRTGLEGVSGHRWWQLRRRPAGPEGG